MTVPLFPRSASTSAAHVDALFFYLVGLTLFFLVVIFVPMIVFLFKYRRGHTADRRPSRLSTLKLELTWTLIPLVIALGTFAWGAKVYFDLERPPAHALEINVVGKQWMWKIQHQEGVREINELHLPVGRTIKLTLASQDVIHSLYIPAFRIKQDVVPGRFTTEWFKPTKVGEYHFYCSEYCGTDHSRMLGTVYVMKPPDYEAWLRNASTGDTMAQAGEKLSRELGCSGCHGPSATVRAPRLEGLYGKPVPLQSGEVVHADDKYIRDSILLPQSQIAAGYEPIMPTFQGRITEGQLFELIAYIKSMGDKSPEEPVVTLPTRAGGTNR